MKKVVLIIAIFLGVTACKVNPFTGKKMLNFYGNKQIFPMAFAQYDQFLTENSVIENTAESRMIIKVGQRISTAAEKWLNANGYQGYLNDYKWEYNLVKDETVNAWCMPGGKIVFYTGILPICDNSDGIAAVMGHEIAHAFAKHGQERMTTSYGQQLGGVAVAIGTSNQDEDTRVLWNSIYGVGSTVGMLAYSRTHESEADKLGMVFMIMAGYDPKEAINVWIRMSQRAEGNSPPEFLSTHPSHETRIADLKAFLPTAKKLAKKYNSQTVNQ